MWTPTNVAEQLRVWVPLKKVDWSWSGTATRSGTNYDYTLIIKTKEGEKKIPPRLLIRVLWEHRKAFLPGQQAELPLWVKPDSLGTNTITVSRRIPKLDAEGDAELISNPVTIQIIEPKTVPSGK